VTYDCLRSPDRADFTAAGCMESSDTEKGAIRRATRERAAPAHRLHAHGTDLLRLYGRSGDTAVPCSILALTLYCPPGVT
jgi:hypothetical protein